jgi:hypothetical protein
MRGDRSGMTLRTLERTAVAGLLLGVGLLVADALEHYRASFFRYIPRFRPERGIWWYLQSLLHNRPALLLGFIVLSAALLIALLVMLTAFVRGLGAREVSEVSVEEQPGPSC